ncbi:dephospho-CoA kinase [Nonlabens sp. YIK11]|uniref:dephospho-CoA kinase n=1 Tax=Nonlabens sp. YIK11 TaxID=1453349 RepID=UPI0006DD0CF7|nr:dephospho-CoA kinase [Nonlabens sp. YIK11]KQC33245.1 dephospho-CoA kinase [Nonlabens sp. YIK11]
MKIVGLTGGIGSGKSTVARAFQNLGVPVYIADDASKRLLSQHPKAMEQVTSLLGEAAYSKDQHNQYVANKKWIASQVFSNKELLEQLNSILHPLVRQDFQEWLSKQNTEFIVYEAAILFESGGDALCDKVIVVWSKEADRIARVMKRDDSSLEDVRQRLQNQWSDQQRLEKADFIVINEEIQLIDQFVKNIQDIMLK